MQLKHEIVLLKRELKDMAELRDKYSTLKTEISSLHVAIDVLKGTKILSQPHDRAALSNKQPKRSYAKAAKAARTHQVPACSPATTKLHSAVSSQPSSIAGIENPSANSQTGSKVKVVGARRIWNTLQTCSAKATATTISKVIPTKLDLRVKRKTKNIANNSTTVWWFVVHGSESDLTIL